MIPELKPYTYDLLDYDWNENDEHYEWVANAPLREILDWCEGVRNDEARHATRRSVRNHTCSAYCRDGVHATSSTPHLIARSGRALDRELEGVVIVRVEPARKAPTYARRRPTLGIPLATTARYTRHTVTSIDGSSFGRTHHEQTTFAHTIGLTLRHYGAEQLDAGSIPA